MNEGDIALAKGAVVISKEDAASITAADTTKVNKTGGTMSGQLTIDAPKTNTAIKGSLNITSSSDGGLNNYDSTGRINLQSYQRAQLNNQTNTNVGQAHYGEVIRIDLKHQQAKGAIAIREDYLGSGSPRTVAWLVAHGESNDSTPENPVWHNHFSIELPDETGALQTSLEFPFAPFNVPNAFGMPTADRYIRAVVGMVAAADIFVEQDPGVAKNIYFSSAKYKNNAGKRWGIQQDNTAESGSNAGGNFRLNRYDDSGTFLATTLFGQRSTGFIGVNITSPTSTFHVGGSFATPVVTTAASAYTATPNDRNILCDSTNNTVSVTLPTAAGKTGREYVVKDWKGTAATNNITILTTSSQKIDAATTKVLNVAYQAVRVVSDGANWSIV